VAGILEKIPALRLAIGTFEARLKNKRRLDTLPNDMLIKIGFDIEFELKGPTPMVLMLFVHPSREPDLRAPQELQVEPEVPVSYYTDLFGNRCARLLAPPANPFCSRDRDRRRGEPDRQSPDAVQHRIEDLPDETLAFLMPSRYCEVDKLSDIAWQLFGDSPPGWPRVQTICTWVHEHITFGYHFADPSKSAFDVYQSGEGVLPRFQPSRAHFLPVPEHPGTLRHRLHGRYRRAGRFADGFQRAGSKFTWAIAGTPSTPGTTSHASGAS
jgi:hypothetical protein